MRARRSVFACVVFLFSFFTATAVAQQCSNVGGGPWIDKYDYYWYINPANANGSVYGGVYTNCGWWEVGGTFNNGTFDVYAVNPYWPYPEGCTAPWFRYVGELQTGGCNVGEGQWTNPSTVDDFWWEKACAIPSSETTHATAEGWAAFDPPDFPLDPNGELFKFRATVANAGGGNLSGRHARETNFEPAADYCYFEGSEIAEVTGVVSNAAFPLDSSNEYPDTVGRGAVAINYYREENKAPCNVVISQRMQIACDDHGFFGTSTSWHSFKDNYLVIHVGASPGNSIASERDSVLHEKTWP